MEKLFFFWFSAFSFQRTAHAQSSGHSYIFTLFFPKSLEILDTEGLQLIVIIGKGKCIYIALFLQYLTLKAPRHGSHSVTCNYTNACLYLVSVHQMAPPQTDVADI